MWNCKNIWGKIARLGHQVEISDIIELCIVELTSRLYYSEYSKNLEAQLSAQSLDQQGRLLGILLRQHTVRNSPTTLIMSHFVG